MGGTHEQSTTVSAPPKTKGHRWFAAMYDRMNRSAEDGILGEMRRALLSGITGDVLETGTGANFEHYGPDAMVTALEPDPSMAARGA